MTAIASPIGAKQTQPDSAHPHAVEQARCVVAEYLRDWGLRDPELVALETRRIVRRADNHLARDGGEPTAQALSETAIRLTIEEIETWISQMASQSRRRNNGHPNGHGSMGESAFHSPDLTHHRNRLPARLLFILEQSVSPVVPSTRRREMRPQPRTRLWKVLRRGYWRQLWKSALACCGRWIRSSR